MILTGHRGAAELEPENTLLSMQKAVDLKVDQIEIDVHLTRDQHLVVIHDTTVDRTTDGQGAVADFTLEEVKRLDAGKGRTHSDATGSDRSGAREGGSPDGTERTWHRRAGRPDG